MQKILIIGAALAALVGSPAWAADLALKAPPPPAPVISWTGLYVGGNVGWLGFDGTNQSAVPNDAPTTGFFGFCFAAGSCPRNYGTTQASGIIGGGQIGYNWQVQSFLIGVETDLQGTGVRSTTNIATAVPGFLPFTGNQTTGDNYVGTVRGRLGFLATPSLLAYGTGGWAYGSVSRNFEGGYPALTETFAGGEQSKPTGWTAGGGVEWMAARGLSLGVEYLYVRLDGGSSYVTSASGAGCLGLCQFRVTPSAFEDNILRFKANFQFGGPYK